MATYYVDGAVGSDSNAGTSPGAGNAFATIGKAESVVVAGDTVNVKSSASYSISSKITLNASSVAYTGYQTTPGDNGTPPIITSITSGLTLFEMNLKQYRRFQNIQFTHTGATRGIVFDAIVGPAYDLLCEDCIFSGVLTAVKFDNLGAEFTGSANFSRCYFTACTGIPVRVCNGTITDCVIMGGSSDGILLGAPGASVNEVNVIGCIIAGNGGLGIDGNSSDGLIRLIVDRCTIANNTSHGIGSSAAVFGWLSNSIFYGNGGYGANFISTVNGPAGMTERSCAYGSNTSGARNNLTAGPGAVSLTANPFTNSGSGDYSLNSTAGGGAACRGAGYPGAFPGISTTGYADIGAVQHQDAGGGSGPVAMIGSQLIRGLRGMD